MYHSKSCNLPWIEVFGKRPLKSQLSLRWKESRNSNVARYIKEEVVNIKKEEIVNKEEKVNKRRGGKWIKEKEKAEALSFTRYFKLLFSRNLSASHLRHHLTHLATCNHLHHLTCLIKLFQQAINFLDSRSATFCNTRAA